MNRLYIAGKVTGQNRTDCLVKFQAAENRVRILGNYYPINPMKIVPVGTPWKIAMKICLKALLTCDAIAILDDWQESPGAQLEVSIAKALGMQIINIKNT